ncbi:MAG: cytochrome c, partial [Chloroflexi bacterium]|nr:cytochrome c [Chloroflexota bacterium]
VEPCNTYPCLRAVGYTEIAIKRAITTGIGADGRELDFMMPRWQMRDSDLDDVIAYLQTLP